MKTVGGLVTVALAVILAAAGCGSGSGVMNDEEVARLAQEIISEVEAKSSPQQKAALEQIVSQAESYNYSPSPVPPVPPPAEPQSYQMEPQNQADYYLMFGTLALLQGSLEASLWAAARAAGISPQQTNTLLQFAVLLLEKKRCQEAERLLGKALAAEDKNELLYLTRAAAYACLTQKKKQAQDLERALELAPQSAVVQAAQWQFFQEDLGFVQGDREEFYTKCQQALDMAFEVRTLAQLNAYMSQVSQTIAQVDQDAVQLMISMPQNLPADYFQQITERDDAWWEKYRGSCSLPLQERTDKISADWQQAYENMVYVMDECMNDCGFELPACCPCMAGECASILSYISDTSITETGKSVASFTPAAMKLMADYELDMAMEIIRVKNIYDQYAAEWLARYQYYLLYKKCLVVAQDAANGFLPVYEGVEKASLDCNLSEGCADAAREAQIEQLQRAQQQAQEQQMLEALAEAEAAMEKVEFGLSGELCFDGLGCLGIDGSKLSVKVGSAVYGQLTVDLANCSVGVRVGAGLSDVTGKLVGADISLGAEFSTSGTTYDVSTSQSMLFGTLSTSQVLFKVTR